jgi:hypothetical protein
MKILNNEILKTFGEDNINISKLNEHGFKEVYFWKFIDQHKNENKKGIYVFVDGDKEFPKNIIYVGKAGESKKKKRVIIWGQECRVISLLKKKID